jgi:hypothetical protein
MAGGSWLVSLENLQSFSLGIGWNKDIEIAPKHCSASVFWLQFLTFIVLVL